MMRRVDGRMRDNAFDTPVYQYPKSSKQVTGPPPLPRPLAPDGHRGGAT